MQELNTQSHSRYQEARCEVFVISEDLQDPALKLEVRSHATVISSDIDIITMTVEVKH
jgi:hypothetical protein